MRIKQWQVQGSYYEACSCEAVCPCRRYGKRPGGRSTYGVCDFVLSWNVQSGAADSIGLSGCRVVMAGSYDDDEPSSPWSVVLYVDDTCTPAQRLALADIFLGRAGGQTFANYARAIGNVRAVRVAAIELDHTPGGERVQAGTYVTVRTRAPYPHTEPITCGIPGHHRPGQELVTDVIQVKDDGLTWSFHGRCGFATTFDYRSA